MSLTITDGVRSFSINKCESLDLELKLNVTAYGKAWSHVGQVLYEFHLSSQNITQTLDVEPNQYDFLSLLLTKKSWELCRGLQG